MLRLGGPREKLAVQRGIWTQTQHLFQERQKQQKSLDKTGRAQQLPYAYRLIACSLSCENANPRARPYAWSCRIFKNLTHAVQFFFPKHLDNISSSPNYIKIQFLPVRKQCAPHLQKSVNYCTLYAHYEIHKQFINTV